MTNREFDLLCIGFSIGALSFLWLGYQLRIRVERWQNRRSSKRWRQAAKTTPFPSPGYGTIPGEQSARRVLRDKPRVIPLERRQPSLAAVPDGDPSGYAIAPHWSDPDSEASRTARAIRGDAVSALMNAGFKRLSATAAVDACTLAERAGGLESWVAAALRRAASK